MTTIQTSCIILEVLNKQWGFDMTELRIEPHEALLCKSYDKDSLADIERDVNEALGSNDNTKEYVRVIVIPESYDDMMYW